MLTPVGKRGLLRRMSTLLRKSDVVAHFGGTFAGTARAFEPILDKPLSRAAVRQWPEVVPELRARQLLDHYPELKDLVLDPGTRLTLREMRERLTNGATG